MKFSEQVLEDFYDALADGDESKLRRVHIPRSEVFYVKAAVEAKTGQKVSLQHVERVLYEEGYLSKRDVHDVSVFPEKSEKS
jgi:hypothetical protein